MVYIPPEFTPATVPKSEAYEGTELDDGVRAVLSKDTAIKWVSTYSASFWAVSSKIDTILSDGTEKSYFLKVYTAEKAKEMAVGEYEGSMALYKALPYNIPKPIAAGVLAKDPKKHFYLAEFRDMKDEMPGTTEFASVVFKLHQTTESPNGKFGFHITTYGGDFPVNTTWCDTWEEFFTRLMRDTMEKERLIQGPNNELDKLSPLILKRVIPRLLRPLESNGDKIKPVLIHGDLWHGNVAVDAETDKPVLYDPCALYGHNEYEFAPWRAARYHTSHHHVLEYLRILNVDESEEQDDRNALYAMAIEEMKRLVEKYCDNETMSV
ncbi:Fructosamine kinase-domain-containing protein [Xylaria bambusicola]|uniref:Fructosamine kinase-domain-containing protein n=1 Tax=Xylaria bambusicola TaxID=326684 RepID=UPI0020086112|nr:Fructosamine kinase-domain-containing protein [Xylaria bambusicola]KAI0521379.1 Fructosamine kinase-domain-containing protein [Xylaria bambusicola]